jgi:methylglutaconyl-CoA hydratase
VAGLRVEQRSDGVLEAVIDRPPQNLLTVDLCAELTELLHHPPEGAHVLVLRAAGTVFCLGRERAGAAPADLVSETRILVALHQALRDSPLVTIAEVHGDAAGFGVGLIAACDVAIAESDAQFSFPEVGINLAPALVLAWLPRVVGEREAFWLTATGEAIGASRARDMGLVNEIVSGADALAKEVAERVAALRARNPRIHSEIKDLLRAFRSLDEDQALELSVNRLVVGALRRAEPVVGFDKS